MDIKKIEKKAKELREELGGSIFAFPVEEENPFSKYAVSIIVGDGFKIYPELMTIEEAAIAVQTTLEMFEKEGLESDYSKLVRFVSFESQVNAPSVTMRRLKKQNFAKTVYQKDIDVSPTGEGYAFSARGVLKFSYIAMVDDNLPKARKFMYEYYKLLSMRKYGKTSAAIKKEVKRMNKDEAIIWLEKTYERYVQNDSEIFSIMQNL